MKDISLFFGAGAEMCYGLPSGGKFALDIFRMDTIEDKKNFRLQRDNINKRSSYAKDWLPQDYDKKPISSFGRSQYEGLVKSSLEYKRKKIIDYLDNFDIKLEYISSKFDEKYNIKIKDAFTRLSKCQFGSENFSHEIKITSILSESNKLFSSNYFSSFLKILEIENTFENIVLKNDIKKFCRSILELLIGAYGEDLVHNLNDGIFEKKPDSIDIFDDLGSIFSLDYSAAGLNALSLLLDSPPYTISEGSSDHDIIMGFSMDILEDLFSISLDYQSLIDSNWRYLYSPKTDWAKFCKISIFLNTTRRYISQIAEQHTSRINKGNGYYHDVLELENKINIKSIGTTNYNNFITEVTKKDVSFLNGSVNDFYDPYLNSIIDISNPNKHFIVPFLFTQSGIKPLTSIKMSERYVSLYHDFKSSDFVAVIGFGFNIDDGHINGLFRSYIEDEGKNLIIFHHVDSFGHKTESYYKDYYQKQLRLISNENITVIEINNDRKITDGKMWYEYLTSI